MKVKTSSMMKILSTAALLVLGIAAVNQAKADVIPADYWTESSTDSAGNYSHSPLSTQNGPNSITGPIPTDANQSSPDNEVVNYLRTGSDFGLTGPPAGNPGTYYNGTLLGDLSGYSVLTATFSITNTADAAGALFTASEIVGERYPNEVGTNAGIRLVFTGGSPIDMSGTPNEWWGDTSVATLTSMQNGQAVTLTMAFDPAQWSNYNGIIGNSSQTATDQFDAALSDVTRIGLSFGSGYFFSDGFAFNNGGNAQIELDSFAAATPEPGTVGLLFGGAAMLLAAARRKRTSRR